jgi:uncharacterized protein YjbJ (UPF0337 family)
MTYSDRLTSPGPARDDPVLGDTTQYGELPDQGASSAGGTEQGGSASDTARQAAGTAKEQAGNVAGTAQDEARNVAGTARDEARNVAGTAKDEARNVAQTAQGQARRLAGDARHELRTQANSQVDRLAQGIDQLSQQLRSMGERGDPGPVTDLAGEAAYRTQQVAEKLRQGGIEDAVDQVKRLGRNRPGLFLLGAFGVGLAAGRVVRNMAQDPNSDDGDVNRSYGDSPYGSGTDAYTAPAVTTGATYAERYEVPAEATGAPVPGAYADDAAQAAYGAPGTAPVGEQRWGT